MATLHHTFWITLILMSNGITIVQLQTSQPYTIGVLAYVDYGLWTEWVELYDEDEADASHRIKQYFVRVADKMNTNYASLGKYNLDVSVVLQRLDIATSSSSAPWSSDNRIANTGRDLLNASQALIDLSNEVMDNADLQQYDHVIGFTGYDLFLDDPTNTIYIGGTLGVLCTDGGSVSIVEDNLEYSSALIGSHEMAHNLGVEHDGDGNDCSGDDHYIMAEEVETAISLPTDGGAGLYCNFSQCSADYIKDFIPSLTDNCLLDAPEPYFTEEEIAQYLADVPGQRKTLDEQCQIHFGPGSAFCGTIYEDGIPCDEISCRASPSGDCEYVPTIRIFDGTTCGDKKWCRKGTCVYNDRAPSLGDCPYGDYRDQNICQRPDIRTLCYGSQNRKLCCDTCSALKDTPMPDCLYGDRLRSCKTVAQPHNCYSKTNSHLCCETCKKYEKLFRNVQKGCKFGDRVPYGVCKQHHCRTSPDACCATCSLGEGYRERALYPDQPYIPLPARAASSSVNFSVALILLCILTHVARCLHQCSRPV